MHNQEQVKKCPCACHDNKLGAPYEHDTKCCENMNGFLTPPLPSSDEEILIELKNLAADVFKGRTSALVFDERISAILAAKNTERQAAVAKEKLAWGEEIVAAVNTLLKQEGRLDAVSLSDDGYIYGYFDGKVHYYSRL